MKRVALIATDRVGTSMAGPGIRSFELAKALSDSFDVTLAVPNSCDLPKQNFKIKTYRLSLPGLSLWPIIKEMDVVIAQYLPPLTLWQIRQRDITYIADLYDPLIIETIEHTKTQSPLRQKFTHAFQRRLLNLQLDVASHLLCANSRQRDLYLGILAERNLINPKTYTRFPKITDRFTLAPFGLPAKNGDCPPRGLSPDGKNDLSDKFPQIKPSDTVVYWGGGVWNWFDPLTAIKAIQAISQKRDDIKLVFVGTAHPNPKIKEVTTFNKAYDYAKKADLLDKFIFFNFGWVPYAERLKFLSRANIGISTHFDNLETYFSFRTRILDYLWARLPIVATKGDTFAEMIEQEKLGLTVDYEDSDEVATAIIKLAEDKKLYQECQDNIAAVSKQFTWPKVAQGVATAIDQTKPTPPASLLRFLVDAKLFYLSGFLKKAGRLL